ncbi:ATP-binding protein [Nitrososphaera sp.]|uniref:cache domain-containing sensor histidine kinase n=1 Tax=Nitrososphaera sp. TaxID=1971748 RepID=UPI00307F95BB
MATGEDEGAKPGSVFGRASAGFAIILVIVVVSYGLFFYFEMSGEFQIRQIEFEHSREDQQRLALSLSDQIGLKLELALAKLNTMLSVVVASTAATAGSDDVKGMAGASLDELEALYALSFPGGASAVLGPDGRVVWASRSLAQYGWTEGSDLSDRSWFAKAKKAGSGGAGPVFAGDGAQGERAAHLALVARQVVAVAGPAGGGNGNDDDDDDNGGDNLMILVQFIPAGLLSDDARDRLQESQTLALLDSDGLFIAYSGDEALIAQPFFSEAGQGATTTATTTTTATITTGAPAAGGRSKDLGMAVRGLMRESNNGGDDSAQKKPASVVYRAGGGEEFLAVATPVVAGGKNAYYLVITTPVSLFYDEINAVLTTQRIQSFSILAGTSVSVIILAVFVNRSINLEREVRRRTRELEESNVTVLAQKKELEQANVELKKLDAMKDEFLSVAAHEIRNPITPIMIAAEELEAELGRKHEIKMIIRNAKKLQQLVQNVLDVARMENRTFKLVKEKFDLGELVSGVVDDYRALAEEKPAVRIEYRPAEVMVRADKLRIAQVMSNLLSNAVKFTKQGTITVEIRLEGGSSSNNAVEVSVTDTGPGIDPAIMPSLFRKFATKSEGGTGLGLYISKNIVEAHGGVMRAQNNPGGGATFAFRIPLDA